MTEQTRSQKLISSWATKCRELEKKLALRAGVMKDVDHLLNLTDKLYAELTHARSEAMKIKMKLMKMGDR